MGSDVRSTHFSLEPRYRLRRSRELENRERRNRHSAKPGTTWLKRRQKKGFTSRACLSLSIDRPPEPNKSTPIDGVEVTRITERSPSTLHGPGLRNRQTIICPEDCNWNWKFVILGLFCNVTHQSRCLSSELGNQLLRSPRVKNEKKKPVEAKKHAFNGAPTGGTTPGARALLPFFAFGVAVSSPQGPMFE